MENIRLALGSLKANKMRSLLTMLGIIIGIGSVIAIVTLGDSLSNNVNKQFADFGGNNLSVGLQAKPQVQLDEEGNPIETPTPETNSDGDMGGGMENGQMEYKAPGESDLITPEMIDAYEAKFKGTAQAIALSEDVGSDTLTNGRNTAKITLTGINPGYMITNKYELITGRWFRKSDLDENRKVALVSEKFITSYFGTDAAPEKHVGDVVTPVIGSTTTPLTIIGVYKAPQNGGYMFETGSTNLFVPITLAKQLAGRPDGYNYITVMPADDVDAKSFMQETGAFFKSYYMQNKDFDIQVFSNEQYLKSMNETMDKLKLIIGAIAAISLLVGGIGVMNIMMVSVTERTREIGVRMALGAKQRTIMMQFVTEAAVICVIGGIFGVLLGIAVGSTAASMTGFPAYPSFTAIFVAVTFSMAIGVFFGWYPAKKAANLDPIEALRYE